MAGVLQAWGFDIMANILEKFIAGAEARQRLESNRDERRRRAEVAPLKKRALELDVQRTEADVAAQRNRMAIEKGKLLNNAINSIQQATTDPAQRYALAQQAAPELAKLGVDIDFNALSPASFTDQSLNEHKAVLTGAIYEGEQNLTAFEKQRNLLMSELEGGIDPETGQLRPADQLTARQRAAAIDLRLIPGAGISAQERIAADPELASRIAESQAQIAGERATATESSKLAVQKILKPQVEEAVRTAIKRAEAVATLSEESRTNEQIYDTYKTGIESLIIGLGGTKTGPIIGRLPALTANAQAAEGAVAVMAPILKAMFRGKGEGPFSDRDQALLMEMVPTRKDSPESILSKLEFIDVVVRSKLGIAGPEDFGSAEGFPEGEIATNEEGQTIVVRRGRWVAQ